jgi:hypothetical protein
MPYAPKWEQQEREIERKHVKNSRAYNVLILYSNGHISPSPDPQIIRKNLSHFIGRYPPYLNNVFFIC